MSSPAPERRARFATIESEMRHLVAAIVLFNQALGDHLDLNPTDLQALGLLLERGPLGAGQLATRAGLTTGTITGVVDRLERAGYARRAADPADRRRVIVEPLVARAEAEIAPLYATLGAAMADACADYSDADLTLIADFLARIHPLNRAETAKLRAAPTVKRGRRTANETGADV